MTTWLVTYSEKLYHTVVNWEEVDTILVKESIKSEKDDTFKPTMEGINAFKTLHEGDEGNYTVEVDLLSWSKIEEE